jgi:hypothetical protein
VVRGHKVEPVAACLSRAPHHVQAPAGAGGGAAR